MTQKWLSLVSAALGLVGHAANARVSPATFGMITSAPINIPATVSLSAPGKYAWEYPTANSVEAMMAVANCSGTPCLLFGDYTAQVHALNAATGKPAGIWKQAYQAGEMIRSTITVFDSSLFFLDGDSKLYALDVNTGTEKWIFKTSAPPQTFACSSPVVVTIRPSDKLAGAVVIVGSVDGSVYSVNASTGAQIWSYSTGKGIYASPTVSQDNTTVFIGSDTGIMYALNAATGALKWQFQCADVIRSGSAIWNGALYFGTNDGVLYALDVLSGSVRFRFTTESYITAVPCIQELVAGQQAVVYIGSYDHSMYAVNATTGAKLWSYATSDSVIGAASVFTPAGTSSSTLYFGGQDGWFYAVDTRLGSLVWKYHVDADIWSRPVFVQGSEQKTNVVFGAQLDPDFGGPSGVWALTVQ